MYQLHLMGLHAFRNKQELLNKRMYVKLLSYTRVRTRHSLEAFRNPRIFICSPSSDTSYYSPNPEAFGVVLHQSVTELKGAAKSNFVYIENEM